MTSIKILGPGCERCRRLEGLVRSALTETGVEGDVEKISDMKEIVRWTLATPGLVVDDVLVSTGRVPASEEVARWLKQAATS